MDHNTTTPEPIEFDHCGLCGEPLESALDVETGVCADCMASSLAEDNSGDLIDVEFDVESPTSDEGAGGTTPDYYKQTARCYGHGLTAIEGQLHDLVWMCHACGESRATIEAFQGVACS